MNIEERFPNEGRALFESEKPIVDAFNEKYREQLKEIQAVFGKRNDPFPRRFDPKDVAVLKERKAVVAFLRARGMDITAQAIEDGKHLN